MKSVLPLSLATVSAQASPRFEAAVGGPGSPPGPAARLLHVAVTRLASSRYRAAGDGGIPVIGGDAVVDVAAAARVKQVRPGSRVLPFSDVLWLSAEDA